jgi:hypothetical protein
VKGKEVKKMKMRKTVGTVVCVLLVLILVFPTALAATYWTEPRPSETKTFDQQRIENSNSDDYAAVGLGVQVGTYVENDPGYGGKDHLSLRIETSANVRVGYHYEMNEYDYAWKSGSEGVLNLGNDDGSWIDFPGHINFYGVSYDKMWVCSNGFLSFDSDSVSPNPKDIPNTEKPNTLIAPYWRDLDPSKGGTISYGWEYVLDHPEPDYFWVTWENVPNSIGSLTQSFQVYFGGLGAGYDYDIRFRYKSISQGIRTIVGVEDQCGSKGTSYVFSNAEDYMQIGFESKGPEGHYGLRYPQREYLKITVTKTDSYAAVNFQESETGGYNVRLKDTSNPFGDDYAFVAAGTVGLMLTGTQAGVIVGATLLIVETAYLLSQELSPVPEAVGFDNALYDEDTGYVKGEYVKETDSRSPHDLSLATTVEWVFSDESNDKDHSLTITTELSYITINIASEWVYHTISTFVDLKLDATPPTAVNLYNPVDITSSAMTLQWSRNYNDDFQKYELWRSTSSDFSSPYCPFWTTVRTTQEYRDYGLSSSTTYYYRVKVIDKAGLCSWSNQVSGKTTSSSSPSSYVWCPYVFPWNGTNYTLDNDILPSAMSFDRPQLDVVDYYKLEQPLVPKDGKYSLQIRENEDEITNLNQLQLITIDHSSDINVAVTQNGDVLTYKSPIGPVSALDSRGRDYLAAVNNTGGDYYDGYRGYYLLINFGNPNVTNDAKLIFRTDIKEEEQKYYPVTTPPVHANGPIKVQILNTTQHWEYVTDIVPRNNWAIDIVDLSPFLQNMSSESFKIRLYWKAHHKLDYIGLDTSQQEDVSIQTYSVSSAIHSRLGDVKNQLLHADDKYTKLIQDDQIEVTFPYLSEGNDSRDVILVSKGYYYLPINGIDIFQNVKVKINVDGTIGNIITMIMLESSILYRYRYAPVIDTSITVASPGPNPANTTFKGYANRNYNILLRYEATNQGTNTISIELEFNDVIKTTNIILDASKGKYQEKYINIDSYLSETLYECNENVYTKTGAKLNLEPRNLFEENDIFGWQSIGWDFGDGTNLTTTNRTITHEYETTGTYITPVILTYDDGATIALPKQIVVT